VEASRRLGARALTGPFHRHGEGQAVQFLAQTFGRTATGLVGAVVMAGAGQQIVEENHILDPAAAIATHLMTGLAKKYQLSPRRPRPRLPSGAVVRWDTDLYLQVTTESWGITYFADDWDHFRVRYEASVELHDSNDGRVLAQGQCLSLPESSKGAPSYEQMLGNQAFVLKKYLEDAVAFCSGKFEELLALRGSERPVPVAVDDQTLYASCHLEETPAWKAAGAADRHKMLEDCWNKRRFQTPPTSAESPAVKP
jgi:hypothetical protein